MPETYVRCIPCHGINGDKNSLVRHAVPNDLSEEDLVQSLLGYRHKRLNRYGKGALMQELMRDLNAKDIEAIAAYLNDIQHSVVSIEDSDSIQSALYQQLCLGCHGPYGSQNPLAPQANPAQLSPSEIEKRLLHYRQGSYSQYGHGQLMHFTAKRLTDRQIKQLAKAIKNVNP